ncbi:MAG: PucR family transcriptional regulator [Solirubrobacterales bacterium]
MSLVAENDGGFAVDASAPSAAVCELIDETLAPAVEEIAAQVTRVIHSHAGAALFDDPERTADTLASCEANVRVQLAVWRTGQDPRDARPPEAAVAYARLYAREGKPLTELLRVYRIGQEEYMRILRHELLTRLPVEAAAAAIDQVSAFVFAYNDAILGRLEQTYLRERANWGERTAAALRRRALPEVLAGKVEDEYEASFQLGYDLRRNHLCVVLWGAGGSELDRAAARIAKRLGVAPPLTMPLGARGLAAWFGSWDPLDPALLPAPAGEVRCALGTPRAGIEGFGASHREALRARRAAEACAIEGAIVAYPEIALASLLCDDPEHARAFMLDEIGPLLGGARPEPMRRLRETLEAYFAELASVSRAARRRGVHENTVQYRLHGAAELLGRGVGERPLELQLALAIARLLPPAPGDDPAAGDPGPIV